MRYKLDRLTASTNQTNLIPAQNIFGFYARYFKLISGIFILVETFPEKFIHAIFFRIVFVDLLNSCVVLRLPSRGNIVAHLQLLF